MSRACIFSMFGCQRRTAWRVRFAPVMYSLDYFSFLPCSIFGSRGKSWQPILGSHPSRLLLLYMRFRFTHLHIGTVSYGNQASCANFGNSNQSHRILIQGLPLEIDSFSTLPTIWSHYLLSWKVSYLISSVRFGPGRLGS